MLKKLVSETCTEQNAALFSATFLYQKLSNTADQSNNFGHVTVYLPRKTDV